MSAIEKIQAVEAWLANEVEAGDEAVAIHRDALQEALRDLRAPKADVVRCALCTTPETCRDAEICCERGW